MEANYLPPELLSTLQIMERKQSDHKKNNTAPPTTTTKSKQATKRTKIKLLKLLLRYIAEHTRTNAPPTLIETLFLPPTEKIKHTMHAPHVGHDIYHPLLSRRTRWYVHPWFLFVKHIHSAMNERKKRSPCYRRSTERHRPIQSNSHSRTTPTTYYLYFVRYDDDNIYIALLPPTCRTNHLLFLYDGLRRFDVQHVAVPYTKKKAFCQVRLKKRRPHTNTAASSYTHTNLWQLYIYSIRRSDFVRPG